MQFFNPWMLLGLAAAAIPILLHLLHLRKLRTIEFSTLRFLQQLQRTQVRRLKLQQWLLLLLRTAVVVFAVLAFARPVIPTPSLVLGSQVRSSIVIILDNSPSMDVRDERGNRFRWAIRQAEQILNALKSGDEVALVTPSAILQSKSVALTTAIGATRDELNTLTLAYAPVPLDVLLETAAEVLSHAQNAHRELYVISDFQNNMFRWQDSSSLVLPAERIVVVPTVAAPQLDQLDLGIDSVGVVTRIVEPGKSVEVAVRIRNNSTRDARSSVVRMQFNGKHVAQRSFDVPAGQVRMVNLIAPAPVSGFVTGTIELEPDACDSDNRRFFALIIPPMPRVLVVGLPRQTQFLEAALSVLGEQHSPIVDRIDPEQLGTAALDEWEVVIIVGHHGRRGVERLRSYLSSGRGNALVFADAALSPAEQSDIAQTLGIGGLMHLPQHQGRTYGLGTVDEKHPLFAGVFRREQSSAAHLESPAIEEALISTAGVPLIMLEQGAFISEHVIGEGRLLYCAVPPTMAWSALPTTSFFPVLVSRAVLYLSVRDAVGAMCNVGERCRLLIPQRYASADVFRIRDLVSTETIARTVRIGGSTIVDVGRPLIPGIMTVETQVDRQPVATAAINIPPSEVALDFTEPQHVASYIAKRVGKEQIEVAETQQPLSNIVARQHHRAELWSWIVGVALLCAVAEMLLAARLAQQTA